MPQSLRLLGRRCGFRQARTENKSPDRPVIPENHRVALVAALECVNAAFIMDDLADFERALDLGVSKLFKNDAFELSEIIGAERERRDSDHT